jgi:hypothetical protein
MSSGDKPCLPPKVLPKFDVEDQVASDMLISDQVFGILFIYFESWSCGLHLFLYQLLPKYIAIRFVNLYAIILILWDFEPIFVCLSQELLPLSWI